MCHLIICTHFQVTYGIIQPLNSTYSNTSHWEVSLVNFILCEKAIISSFFLASIISDHYSFTRIFPFISLPLIFFFKPMLARLKKTSETEIKFIHILHDPNISKARFSLHKNSNTSLIHHMDSVTINSTLYYS